MRVNVVNTGLKLYSPFLKCFFFFFFLIQFNVPFALSSFFTHIETNQSVGGEKTGEPGEKPPDTLASRTWFVPHATRAHCDARTHSMIKSTEVSDLNHSATGAALFLKCVDNDIKSPIR